MPVVFSIYVLSCDRKSKAFSSCTADPSNLQPIMHQSKIADESKGCPNSRFDRGVGLRGRGT